MIMSGIKALWLFGLSFSFFAASSQTSADSIKRMEDVVITATRKSTAAAVLPYAVNVLDQNSIQTQLSRTVPESLSGVPGLFIQKTNHGGGSPFLRGLTGNQSLILVDGIRLNNSIFRFGPNQYLTLVDPYLVEKIEVIKGTGSVQHGSDAMTGVINIQTTSLQLGSKPSWQSKVLIRLTESGMEFTQRPELKYEGKKFAFVLGATSKKFGDLKGGDTTGFQRPTGYGEFSYDMKMKIDLGAEWQLTAACGSCAAGISTRINPGARGSSNRNRPHTLPRSLRILCTSAQLLSSRTAAMALVLRASLRCRSHS
jgi:outer membrane cobalamin receptor